MRRKPKVGELLYCVPKDQRWYKPKYIKVNKVGKLYFYADNERYRISDWAQDDGRFSSSSTLYEDEEEYERYVMAFACRNKIRDLVYKLNTDQVLDIYARMKNMLLTNKQEE